MTFEELLETSIEKQEALSDAELEKLFEPYFNVTRPDRQNPKERLTTKSVAPAKVSFKKELDYKKEQARKLAEQLGINLGI